MWVYLYLECTTQCSSGSGSFGGYDNVGEVTDIPSHYSCLEHPYCACGDGQMKMIQFSSVYSGELQACYFTMVYIIMMMMRRGTMIMTV